MKKKYNTIPFGGDTGVDADFCMPDEDFEGGRDFGTAPVTDFEDYDDVDYFYSEHYEREAVLKETNPELFERKE